MNEKGYANPQLLIFADELKDRLDDGSICLVDVRPTHEYVEGHIPGAIHLDLFAISLSDTSEQVFDAFMWTIAYLFKDRGIDPTKTIVWYENESGVKAARGFWFCEYLGHEDVRVLDGGLSAWSAAGGEVSTEPVAPEEVAQFSTDSKVDAHMDAETIHGLLDAGDFAVLDTRAAAEHYGDVARSARGGAIPGSIHIEWMNNLDENGMFRPAAELRELYESAGITPEKRVMSY